MSIAAQISEINWALRSYEGEDGSFDLSPLKSAAAMLPTTISAEEGRECLDLIHAILFHLLFPMRERAAGNWFDENYVPPNEHKIVDNDGKGHNLLLSLGLVQAQAPIKRRV
jgi:hypothetical protein